MNKTAQGLGFVDFANLETSQSPMVPRNPRTPKPPSTMDERRKSTVEDRRKSTTTNRFAAFTNSDIERIKIIDDAIQTISEEEATTSSLGPELLSLDLARIISRALTALNLQPGSREDSLSSHWEPQAKITATTSELNSTIKLQNALLEEVSRSLQSFAVRNTDLIKGNLKLVQERF